MPRSAVSGAYRQEFEASFSSEVDLIFITITHSIMVEPIRVVSENVDYSYAGFNWIGFPFDIKILTDSDKPPEATLTLQNVDQRIGESVRYLTTPPRLKIELLSSIDFDLTVTPRAAIGTPTVVYMADKLFLTNIKVDSMVVQADIGGWNYLQRTWPGPRATQAVFPGLFR